MAAKANIVIDQGSDFSTTLTITDENDNILDLTGYSANAHIRRHYTSETAKVLGCTFAADRTSGRLTLSFGSEISAGMESGRYVYDVEILSGLNTRSRLVEGICTITPEVTRA
jgi:hypothetical protein